MYKNKVIDGLLKHISERVVANADENYLKEAAFNPCYSAGISNIHLVPTDIERMKTKFYGVIARLLPEDYLVHGRKVVNEWQSRPLESA